MATQAAPAPANAAEPTTKEKIEAAKAKAKTKEKPVVVANAALAAIVASYDDAAEKASSYYVELIEFIKKENISRPVLVKTLMEARHIEQATADSQASRIMSVAKNEEVFNALRNGEITLKVAREIAKKPQKNPAAQNKPAEAREKVWESAVKALIQAAKDNNFEVKFVLKALEAELRSAGLK